MSDTARTDEIDDVVSSVRKLVSHSEKNAPRVRVPRPRDSKADRFVLTPALRVSDPQLESDADDARENLLVLEPATRADRAGLEETIAELEAAVTAQPDEWEADEGENLDAAAWAASAFQLHAVSDAAEDAALSKEDTPDTPVPDDMPLQGSASGTLPVDDDALRAIVVAILREELSGDMGERMTRNVRKLVRREINRVLVSRDME